jgi:membrane-associated phospholipid phosphatase
VPALVTGACAVIAASLLVAGLQLVRRHGRLPTAEEVAAHTGLRALAGRRLDPVQVSTLALTVGLLAVTGMVAGFGAAAVAATRTPVWWVDAALADWGSRAATPAATAILEGCTTLGATWFVTVVAVVVGLVEAFRRRPGAVAFVLVAVAGQNVINNAVKLLVQRARPPVEPLTANSGFSFPSGHTAAAAATYAVIALLLARGHPWRARVGLAGAAAALTCMVGASRVLLGVHWLTDVIAGALVGLLWFGVCALLFGGARLALGTALTARPRVRGPRIGDRVGRRAARARPAGPAGEEGGTMSQPHPGGGPSEEQVRSRADSLQAEPGNRGDDTDLQAEALLEESEARVEDPAARAPGDERVLRRRADDTLPPDPGSQGS